MAVAQSLRRSPGSTLLDSSIERVGQLALSSLHDTLLDYYAATENRQKGAGMAVCIQSQFPERLKQENRFGLRKSKPSVQHSNTRHLQTSRHKVPCWLIIEAFPRLSGKAFL